MTDTLRETLDGTIDNIVRIEIEVINCFNKIINQSSLDLMQAQTCYEEILKIHKLLQSFQELRAHAYDC